ncbi:MAG: peptide deformylase [Dysgonamonadaceae bacterium]|jgi:peptide deformylase|nr:peptide deformylase [Dysgonamonadaceae bacterium]
MILPIYVYGHPLLRKIAQDITPDYPDLKGLVANMFETMHNADGVGLAAPQIGLDIRVLVIDLTSYADTDHSFKDFKKTMINARILEADGEEKASDEGCLSIPGINESVYRKNHVKIKYVDVDFVEYEEDYYGHLARVIQHEYDHLEGKMFVDYLSGFRKQLIKSKLNNLINGKVRCSYRVKTVKK